MRFAAAVALALALPSYHEAQSMKPGQSVTLKTPAGLDKWIFADNCTNAWLLVTNASFRAQVDLKSEKSVTYTNGSAARVLDVDERCVYAEIKSDESAGWVDNSLVQLSDVDRRKAAAEEAVRRKAEEQKRKKAAAEAEDSRRVEAERKAQLRSKCGEVYRDTIDKKLRDLTVREEQQVRACQALGMYPPR